MDANIFEKSAVRFTISNEGWARLNAGRKASHLIREAISNTFDADDVTEVRVRLEPGYAAIEDNSPTGIADPALVSTVFMTDKQDSPTKRGRKGRGLKELISAATWAEVDTIGFKTTFTEGRVTEKSERARGTKVSVKVPTWTQEDMDETTVYMSKVIAPSNIKFYVNDVLVKPRKTRTTIEGVYLKTQLVVEGVQKDTYRHANVEVVNLAKGETRGHIYEMGIPIQEIPCRFHVNITQRVPLNDNRDTVEQYYLQALYGNLLQELLPTMSAEALRHEWVDHGLYNLSQAQKEIVVRKLYGPADRLAIKSSNQRMNDIAKQNGYRLLTLAGLTSNMEVVVKAVIPLADMVVLKLDENQTDEIVPEEVADPTGRLSALVSYLGRKLIGHEVSTEFFRRPSNHVGKIKLAQYREESRTIQFNVSSRLPLNNPLHCDVLSTIIHELAHDLTPMHDQQFLEEVQRLGGQLSLVMLEHHEAIKKLIGGVSKKQVLIHCTVCSAERYVCPQDVHQVDKCVECTKKARRQRAKERRQGLA